MFSTMVGMALALLFAPLSTAAAGNTDPGSVVDRYFEAYSSMNGGDLLNVYAPDAVFVDVVQRHEVTGAEAIQQYVGQIFALHLKVGVKEKRRVVSGGQVVVEFAYTGTVSGAALRQATGKTTCQDTDYEVPATSWFEVRDGHIARQTDFIDLATLEEVKKRAAGQGY